MKKLTITALALITAFAGTVPAQAFPVVSQPNIETTSTDVQQVQYWRHRGNQSDRADAYYNHRGNWNGRGDYRGNRYYGNRYDHGRYYDHHHGSNAGAIIGGLAAGALIGGALAQPRYASPRRYVGSSHAEYCYSRYRSYRASDNTYQPNSGPRRQCQ